MFRGSSRNSKADILIEDTQSAPYYKIIGTGYNHTRKLNKFKDNVQERCMTSKNSKRSFKDPVKSRTASMKRRRVTKVSNEDEKPTLTYLNKTYYINKDLMHQNTPEELDKCFNFRTYKSPTESVQNLGNTESISNFSLNPKVLIHDSEGSQIKISQPVVLSKPNADNRSLSTKRCIERQKLTVEAKSDLYSSSKQLLITTKVKMFQSGSRWLKPKKIM